MNNDTQIEECVRHSDIVINLVGREYETKYVLVTNILSFFDHSLIAAC